MTACAVIRPGLLTTVQDLGRWGYQDRGVPVAGPMDLFSHRLANRLVGNDEQAAALEIALVGPELRATGELFCAITGALFEVFVDDRRVDCGQAFRVGSGATLRFGRRLAGARSTLAFRGGIDVPPVLGSRATSLVSGLGPFGGRALAAGDLVPIGRKAAAVPAPPAVQPLRLPEGGARLRAIPGPQETRFASVALERLFSLPFTVTTQSNRMGFRLEGPELPYGEAADILSDATPLGSLQVPGSGQPILLMADRQTTGGYPKIATVIAADVPLAGQLAPGDWIRFVPCTRADALNALNRLERRLAGQAS
jgi:antagonist of KipI